jgi:hypothetical protein
VRERVGFASNYPVDALPSTVGFDTGPTKTSIKPRFVAAEDAYVSEKPRKGYVGSKENPRWGPMKELIEGGKFRMLQSVVIDAPRHTGWSVGEGDSCIVVGPAGAEASTVLKLCGECEQMVYEVKLPPATAVALHKASQIKIVTTTKSAVSENVLVPEGWLRPKGTVCTSTGELTAPSVTIDPDPYNYRLLPCRVLHLDPNHHHISVGS